MAKLEIQSVSQDYDNNTILNDISFNAEPGQLTCLVGPSGCGKSTLLRLIAGLDKIKTGEIKIDGKSINNTPTRKRNVGLVFQHPSLFPHLTVRGNIEFGLNKKSNSERKQICNDMLDIINLKSFADYYPHQLSGGQHQRVALARALAPKPSVMLLDEPFANLDHALRCEIRDEIVGVLKQAQMPIIMVTHSPDEALIMADKMVLLSSDGKIQQVGKPDDMHNSPIDINSAAFFGPINKIAGRINGDIIHSKLGNLAKNDYADKLKDGDEVVIVTRPEGLRIATNNEPCIQAKVTIMRHTGAGWLIDATLPDGDSITFHHIYGECPQKGEEICITYEPPHVFVFLLDNC